MQEQPIQITPEQIEKFREACGQLAAAFQDLSRQIVAAMQPVFAEMRRIADQLGQDIDSDLSPEEAAAIATLGLPEWMTMNIAASVADPGDEQPEEKPAEEDARPLCTTEQLTQGGCKCGGR